MVTVVRNYSSMREAEPLRGFAVMVYPIASADSTEKFAY